MALIPDLITPSIVVKTKVYENSVNVYLNIVVV